MAQRYRITAHSRQANQTQQSMDLINDQNLADAQYAQRVAESFAARLNREFFLTVNDWQGSIEVYEHIENPQPYQFPGPAQ